MRLEDTFEVQAPIDTVYNTILDVSKVTGCVPGAELVSTNGDVSEVGIRVKVGPISMQYRGEVEIVERDAANHRAVMKVRAREVRGQGTAEATATLSLSQNGGSTTTGEVEVEVDLTGRAASMGQGAIQDVSSKLVGRFARNLTRMLSASDQPLETAPDNDLSAADIAGAVAKGRLRQPGVAAGALAVVAAAIISVLLLGRRSNSKKRSKLPL